MTSQVIDDLCGCCALTNPVTEALSRRSEKKGFWNVHAVADDSKVGAFMKSAHPFVAHALTHSKRPLDLFLGNKFAVSPVSSQKYRNIPSLLEAGALCTGPRKERENGCLQALLSLANDPKTEERSTELLVVSDSQVQSTGFHHTSKAPEKKGKQGYNLHSNRPYPLLGDACCVVPKRDTPRVSGCWNVPSHRSRKLQPSATRQQGACTRRQRQHQNLRVQGPTGEPNWFHGSAVTALNYTSGEVAENFHVGMPNLLEEHKNVDLLPSALQNAITYLAVTNFAKEDRQKKKCLLPPQKAQFLNRLTLVLEGQFSKQVSAAIIHDSDMDETLMHCSTQPLGAHPDFLVHFADTNLLGNVYIRPFAKLFLDLASQLCEIVVFTASTQAYADQVLAQLDPESRFVHHRLYRQHCTVINGGHVKDLRLLGRDASKVILADNSPISMALQPDNGIIVSTWTTDYDDKELMDLLMLIQHVSTLTNVPEFLRSRYGFRKWINRVRSPLHPL